MDEQTTRIVAIGSIVTAVLGAFIYMNALHADAADFKQFKIYSQREFTEIRIERIVLELNNLTRREAGGFMTKYDFIREDELEREWELLKGQQRAE